jgi:hypothetical protein
MNPKAAYKRKEQI